MDAKPLRLFPAEHHSPTLFHAMAEGQTVEDALKPEFWSHVTKSIQPGYKIELQPEDGAWWALAIVVAVSPREATVKVIHHVDLGGMSVETASDEFEIKWRGPARKFSVIRKSDNAVMAENIQTRAAAEQWVKNRSAAMAA